MASVLLALALAARADTGESHADLRAQIESLASRHGFAVVGLDRLEDAPARVLAGDGLERDLRAILGNYNYLLVHDPDGRVRRLRILGLKSPAPRRHSIRTTRRGSHHLVETELVGPSGESQTFSLMLDTGASLIVLPSSKIEALGFRPEELKLGTANTANGEVPIRLGTLRQVWIGQARVDEVAVGFVADDRIGERYLLGMSFLNHFRVTIDDRANRLTLLPR
ncbi:MAG: aspartyl protease family protein [Kiloniellales bacterium]|nr:aspartyl protease family protein [Kiloniellales bacterium]